MTPAELLAATAADMRAVADASPPAPWDFNSYSAIFSGPLMRDHQPWSDPLFDAGHSLERVGECQPCGQWREPIPCGVPWSRGHGCRHAAEDYERDPLVAKVPASAGDTSHGSRKASAEHIAAWDPEMARTVAAWLDTYRTIYSWARSLHEVVNVNGDAGPIDVCQAWWKSRGREPVAS